MIIDTLNLTHFGRFHQASLRLSPGINVIYGENEAGKSTIHQFIQAMLFGVERLRGKASKKDAYSRFQPWEQGKNYEGSMVLEHEGEMYRLTRNFYKEDEYFRVEQLRTGKEILLPGGQIDGLVDGLTRNNFKNTLSISQLESSIDSRFGLTLQAYMANIQRTKNQEVDLQQTLDYLRKEKKARLDRGAERELQDLKRQMTALEAEEDGYSQLLEDIRQQQEMLEQVRGQRQSAKVSGRESRKREQQERMEAIRLIEENNYVADQYQRKKAAYEQLKQQAAEADFDAMKEEWDAANEEYDALSDDYSQLMGRNLAILFSVMMFGLIPVVAVFFLKNNLLVRVGILIVFVALLAVTALLLQLGRKRMAARLGACRENLDELHDEMEQHMFGRGSREMLRQMKGELQALSSQYEQLQIPLQPYIEKYGEDISLDMEEDEEDETLELLRQKEESLTKSLERLLVQKEALEEKTLEREALESDIQRLSEEVRAEQEQAGVIDECMAIIRDLSEEIHSDFGPALNREVSRMMWELTGGKYERVVVDNELNLRVDTEGHFADSDQLSTGTREQLYLALRLAMVKLLFPKNDMPVIFDDSFVFYDDRRLARTLSWIGSQGFSQVILFTCQHREMDALERLGVAYTPIYMDCN